MNPTPEGSLSPTLPLLEITLLNVNKAEWSPLDTRTLVFCAWISYVIYKEITYVSTVTSTTSIPLKPLHSPWWTRNVESDPYTG